MSFHSPLVVTHRHTNKASSWHGFFKIISSRVPSPSELSHLRLELWKARIRRKDLLFIRFYNPRSIFGRPRICLGGEEGEQQKHTALKRFRSSSALSSVANALARHLPWRWWYRSTSALVRKKKFDAVPFSLSGSPSDDRGDWARHHCTDDGIPIFIGFFFLYFF